MNVRHANIHFSEDHNYDLNTIKNMYNPKKRTINWGKDINFIKLFNTKVSRK